jgi:hypothetical protein
VWLEKAPIRSTEVIAKILESPVWEHLTRSILDQCVVVEGHKLHSFLRLFLPLEESVEQGEVVR